MHAIETIYHGYRFRSRLEARWAVFFDALGLEWEYEKEGYDLGEAGRYLPDFWLPDVDGGTWVEVKGEDPGWPSKETDKLGFLCDFTKRRGLLVIGEPHGNTDDPGGELSWTGFYPNSASDNYHMFCVCPWCGKVGISYQGRGARVCGWKKHHATEGEALAAIKHLGFYRADDRCHTYDAPSIKAAAIAARQARFEHGENGAPR